MAKDVLSSPSLNRLSAIGSIATAVAAMVAAGTFIFTLLSYSSNIQRASAEKLRSDLQAYAQESQTLSQLLNDGSALIMGVAKITEELKERLGPSATPTDFWRTLDDNPTMLSIIVVGWNESKSSERLNAIRDSQRRISLRLTGSLSLLHYTDMLYDNIVQDAYSPTPYYTVIEKGKNSILQSLRNEKSLPMILRSISAQLDGGVRRYYIVRHKKAVEKINKFIQDATQCLTKLRDKDLARLSQASVPAAADQSETVTGAVHILLKDMRTYLGDQDYERLSSLMEEIKREVTKDKATLIEDAEEIGRELD